MLPNFYCIGAAKAGSTSLHNILSQHPDIYLPDVKETKYISLNYEKGLTWYEREYFRQWSGESAVGEIYPCLALAEAPKRLYESFGSELKLIVIIRNPIDRAYSHYLAQKRIYGSEVEFEDALASRPAFVEGSLYAKQVSRFLEYFPVSNMHFIIFESDFLRERAQCVRRLQKFLGIDDVSLDVNVSSNVAWEPRNRMVHRLLFNRPKILTAIGQFFLRSKGLRQQLRAYVTTLNARKAGAERLQPEARRQLQERYFASDIEKLEKLITRDLSLWKIDGT